MQKNFRDEGSPSNVSGRQLDRSGKETFHHSIVPQFDFGDHPLHIDARFSYQHGRLQRRMILPLELSTWRSLSPQLKAIAEKKVEFNPRSFCSFLAELSFRASSCSRYVSNLSALDTFLSSTLKSKESRSFFAWTLPFIAQQALRLPELFSAASVASSSSSSGLPTTYLSSLSRGQKSQVKLSQDQICSLIASAFLLLLPDPTLSDNSNFANADFGYLFQDTNSSTQEKLRCFMTYFDQKRQLFSSNQAAGQDIVTIQRVSLQPDQLPTSAALKQNHSRLSAFTIQHSGGICDSGPDYIKTDFANALIGGGVLRSGSVQEEIMCLEHPEMLAAMLVCERMMDNEAIIIKGAQRYCKVSGYSDQIRYEGAHTSRYPRQSAATASPMIDSEIVAIDALDFSHKDPASQYKEAETLREIGKMFSGYRHANSDGSIGRKGVATGNWGCGAFKGDPQYKCLLTWIACSLSGRNVLYYPMGNADLHRLQDVISLLTRKQCTVSELYDSISSYHGSIGSKRGHNSVFDHVMNWFGGSGAPTSAFSTTWHSPAAASSSSYSSYYSNMTSNRYDGVGHSLSGNFQHSSAHVERGNLPCSTQFRSSQKHSMPSQPAPHFTPILTGDGITYGSQPKLREGKTDHPQKRHFPSKDTPSLSGIFNTSNATKSPNVRPSWKY